MAVLDRKNLNHSLVGSRGGGGERDDFQISGFGGEWVLIHLSLTSESRIKQGLL